MVSPCCCSSGCCWRGCRFAECSSYSASSSSNTSPAAAAASSRGRPGRLQSYSLLLLLLLLLLLSQSLFGSTAALSLQQQTADSVGGASHLASPAAAAAAAAAASAHRQQQQQQQLRVALAFAAAGGCRQGSSSRQQRLLPRQYSSHQAAAAAAAAAESSRLHGNCCFSAAASEADDAAPKSGCCGGSGGAPAAAAAAGGVDTPQIPRVGVSAAGPRPDWFHVPAPRGEGSRFALLTKQIRGLKLHTVCEEAKCPNIGECWEGGTATLMLLGDTCTRGCRFCAIKTAAKPPPPDPDEPRKVAEAVAQWDIDYIVLTSVDRDDMPDGGAGHFAETVRRIKELKPAMFVECLVSDFQGMKSSVELLAGSGLDVYAHNVETVPRLSPFVRDRRASFSQSLSVLQMAKNANPRLFTKTSLMVGLGETEEEVAEALRQIRSADVDAVTLGQYLRPTKQQLGVVSFVSPQQFEVYRQLAMDLGFKYVASGPLTRSSYRAGEFFLSSLLKKQRAKLQADVGHLQGSKQQVLNPKAK
ncbi:hypothetical protein Efla_005074 [Eimeria flavescens]